MNVIEGMESNAEVPDDIYLSALDNARTAEEVAFRDVLVFHRDALNGGLDQALDNQAPDRERLLPFIHAYNLIGLNELAALIGEAHDALFPSDKDAVASEFDELAERYMLMTFGRDGSQPDSVERQAVAFARSRRLAFSNISAGIGRGQAKAWADELVSKIEDLARRLKEGS